MAKTANTAPALDLLDCIDTLDKAAGITRTLQLVTATINDKTPQHPNPETRDILNAYEITQMHLMEFLDSTMQTISAALSAISKAA